jgi:hypothetical protein
MGTFRVRRVIALALLGIAALPGGAARGSPPPSLDPAGQCRAAIRAAERERNLPPQLLQAIARVESGRRDPATGAVTPWPWTINAEGRGRFFPSPEEAIAHVRQLQARGVRLIDVGCMQINLHHHPSAFANLEEAFDPVANARYAARFLAELHASRGDWVRAAANYHSNTPELAEAYRQRVLAAWPAEQRRPYTIRDEMADAWARTRARPQAGPGAPGMFAGGLAVPSLSNRADRARILPLASGGNAGAGRGLDAYRAAPIAVAGRRLHVVQIAEAPERR